ncbi:hypothetical protein Tco_0037784 [Tanacetum coccineum]
MCLKINATLLLDVIDKLIQRGIQRNSEATKYSSSLPWHGKSIALLRRLSKCLVTTRKLLRFFKGHNLNKEIGRRSNVDSSWDRTHIYIGVLIGGLHLFLTSHIMVFGRVRKAGEESKREPSLLKANSDRRHKLSKLLEQLAEAILRAWGGTRAAGMGNNLLR